MSDMEGSGSRPIILRVKGGMTSTLIILKIGMRMMKYLFGHLLYVSRNQKRYAWTMYAGSMSSFAEEGRWCLRCWECRRREYVTLLYVQDWRCRP
jgi:hypothetical protein